MLGFRFVMPLIVFQFILNWEFLGCFFFSWITILAQQSGMRVHAVGDLGPNWIRDPKHTHTKKKTQNISWKNASKLMEIILRCVFIKSRVGIWLEGKIRKWRIVYTMKRTCRMQYANGKWWITWILSVGIVHIYLAAKYLEHFTVKMI